MEAKKEAPRLLQKDLGANVILKGLLQRKDIDILQYNKELEIILNNNFIDYVRYFDGKTADANYYPFIRGNKCTVKSLILDSTNANYLAFSKWGDVFLWVDGCISPSVDFLQWQAMYYSTMYRKASVLMLIDPNEAKRWENTLTRFPTTRKRVKLIDRQTFKPINYAS